ncbi:magnesium protoporphyrin IX methyltransferase [Chloroflexales bacterium ZM16-3]|nr:magnesium protoporphyrin IX methyltransferase [Chloroflexales bacterium ZM16-3]
MLDTAQHKARLRSYFDGVGFSRWSAIYGDANLSAVRKTIRAGHAVMLSTAEAWAGAAFPQADDATALDAGCGTGLFSLALARHGFNVSAVDLAPQMAVATAANAEAAGLGSKVAARAADLDEITGSYDLVSCFDVLIHYPSELFGGMLSHLASLSRGTLLFTYAPYSPILAAMHRVGGYFPHSQRRTDIKMIRETQVRQALADSGMHLRRSARVGKGFYHVMLVEASRTTA